VIWLGVRAWSVLSAISVIGSLDMFFADSSAPLDRAYGVRSGDGAQSQFCRLALRHRT
jgi:hypothetical protein